MSAAKRTSETIRREVVLSPDEDKMLDEIRADRAILDPLNRNEAIRLLIREEHARLARRHTQRTRTAAPKETQEG